MKKVILITGSSRGIGKATAQLAHQQGWRVILHGRTQSDHLKKLQSSLSGSFAIACDIADKPAVAQQVKIALDHFGRIDALVNSAGSVTHNDFLKTTPQEFERMLHEHILGTTYFCQAVIPQMQRQKQGRIVNISSIRGYSHMASTGAVAYSVAKQGVRALTASLAKIYAPDILVNAVAPGFVETDISKQWSDKTWKQALEGSLLNRPGQPKEIAAMIMFLVGEGASFITGQTFLVDGGYSLGGK